MDNLKLFSVFAGLAVAAGLVAGAVVLHFAPAQVVVKSGASAAGSTFNTAKTAMIVWVPSTTAATTTSIYNGDANDRIIKQATISCTSVDVTNNPNLAAWIFTAATTSAVSQGLQGKVPTILSQNIATTSSQFYLASTTPGLTGVAVNRQWSAGTYLTFFANSSSTATCVIGVDYIGT